jgi:hypothetical protein
MKNATERTKQTEARMAWLDLVAPDADRASKKFLAIHASQSMFDHLENVVDAARSQAADMREAILNDS